MLKSVKNARTLVEIEKEHGPKVYRSGQLQYQIFALTDELCALNEEIKDLNLEASALMKAEKEAKDAEAAAAAKPVEVALSDVSGAV